MHHRQENGAANTSASVRLFLFVTGLLGNGREVGGQIALVGLITRSLRTHQIRLLDIEAG